jgi:hypothetical protein
VIEAAQLPLNDEPRALPSTTTAESSGWSKPPSARLRSVHAVTVPLRLAKKNFVLAVIGPLACGWVMVKPLPGLNATPLTGPSVSTMASSSWNSGVSPTSPTYWIDLPVPAAPIQK